MSDAPWLSACKRLAVGQTQRYRCCGRTPAAVLYNKPESWQMYCHRCKQTAIERKQFVSLVQPQVLPRVLPAPAHLIRVSQASAEIKAHAYSFMVSKGLMPEMLEDALWSEELKRLVFQTGPGTYIARAMHSYQQPKWLMLGGAQSYAVAAPVKALGAVADAGLLVLTEDYFSAVKYQYALDKYTDKRACAITILGTRLPIQLRAWIVQHQPRTIIALDNDIAGHAGSDAIHKALRPFTNCKQVFFKADPKDATIKELIDSVE